ncbi:hypothetical protein GALMADRAFT_147623 [Galerina marginata CBS 339.88]|uniref:Uncharacterized protein n=1 Tax=Galerina marginata (strain CBS 339.88) TaxID=685588 RepID=A0A067S7A8_GALM3|nr:hypothetical protein GALMADRAFT_147623 [Galerina marginata CBS 339.88]
MRLLIVTQISLLASFAAGYDVKANSGNPYSEKCFTCPQISKFHTGGFRYESPSYVKYNEIGSFLCSYWEGGYYYDTADNQHKYQKDQFIGKCEYNSQSGALDSGSEECWKKAATNKECTDTAAHNADKGTYLKKCDQAGCGYETAACYTCPRTKSDHVNIDTRNGGLECKYYTKGHLDDTCRYNNATGALTGKQKDSVKCPVKASNDNPCLKNLRETQQRENENKARKESARIEAEEEARKVADRQKNLEKNGLWAVGCETTLLAVFPSETALRTVLKATPEHICQHWTPEELLAKLQHLNTKAFGKEWRQRADDYIKTLESNLKND